MEYVASRTSLLSLLTISAAMVTAPVHANYFSDLDSEFRHNIGSAPNPGPQDMRSAYPPMSRKMGEQGEVRLKLSLSESGSVTSAVVAKSSGITRLDDAAIQYVKSRWSFHPARGQEMPRDTELSVKFVLQ